jgi:hypothetical protein
MLIQQTFKRAFDQEERDGQADAHSEQRFVRHRAHHA